MVSTFIRTLKEMSLMSFSFQDDHWRSLAAETNDDLLRTFLSGAED